VQVGEKEVKICRREERAGEDWKEQMNPWGCSVEWQRSRYTGKKDIQEAMQCLPGQETKIGWSGISRGHDAHGDRCPAWPEARAPNHGKASGKLVLLRVPGTNYNAKTSQGWEEHMQTSLKCDVQATRLSARPKLCQEFG
jgi:hypothetical protein